MSYTDGFSPHRWTAGISGQDSETLTQGIGKSTRRKKRISKKR